MELVPEMLTKYATISATIRVVVLTKLQQDRPSDYEAIQRLVEGGWTYRTDCEETATGCEVKFVIVSPKRIARTIAQFSIGSSLQGPVSLQ